MTVNILIQIDKLVQLLESPVFTCRPLSRSLEVTSVAWKYTDSTRSSSATAGA